MFAIDYLSGLTNFTFDKAVLLRVAHRRGISECHGYDEIDDVTEWACTRDLLLTVLRGPWSTASVKQKHGAFEMSVGQQTITANVLEKLEAQVRDLNKKLGLDEDDGIPDVATNVWIEESDC